MRSVAILYHDVVEVSDDESGFPGAAAARYKLTRADFGRHLDEIGRRLDKAFVAVPSRFGGDAPHLFTVDDGGKSSTHIARELDKRRWIGHFFVTTNHIGAPTFLARDDIRALRAAGHVIGSHSSSHPFRMSELPDEQLTTEWRDSVAVLSDLLGEAVRIGSVPSGFYAPRVAAAAHAAGIATLFTSEPTTKVSQAEGCTIVGRFNVYRGMSAAEAGNLADGARFARLRQQVLWSAKKLLKSVAAPVWDRARHVVFAGR